MDNVDLNVLRQVAAWLEAGHKAVLGTVTRTWGSAPRPVGSVVAVRGDGVIAGSVSGGCIEDDLIEKVRAGALALADHAEIVRYGVGAEEAQRFGLPCGGTMELVLEPVTAKSRIPELLALLGQGRRARRVLDLASAEASLGDPTGDDAVVLTATTLTTTHGPRWRLLLIGAGQLTQYLARMAQALDYAVVICDPREEYPDEPDLGVERVRTMPDDTVVAFKPDGHTAVIALTHDPKLDDLALMEALGTEAFYIGAIGSRANQAKRKQRLAEHFDVKEEQLARLHGPVGLHIGARTPPEIAVAILAEMTAIRHGVKVDAARPPSDPAQAGCVM
ncbi:MAG TPA: XdhC family protein [Ideonella sp.]|nr:XdhC family protein [Ideonella sp.]